MQLFYLHTPSGSFRAPPVPSNLPTILAGQPVRYFWKDVIRVGHYVHPRGGPRFPVDRARIDRWIAAFRRMRANGVRVTVPADHSHLARDNLGYVIALKRVGGVLYALHQLIGEDAMRLAARNEVSLAIHPDFTDGLGNRYGEAIVHSSLTPVPVVPGQGKWRDSPPTDSALIASRAGPSAQTIFTFAADGGITPTNGSVTNMDITPEQLAEAQSLLPDGEPLSAENFVQRVLEFLRQCAPNADGADLSRTSTDGDPPLRTMSLALPDEQSSGALVEAARAKKELAVARGALSPAVADRLFARLVRRSDGSVNAVALSRSSPEESCLALGVFDDLAENRPVPRGESTGVQTLARVIPNASEPGLDPKLQERMIALASGR